MMKNTLSWTRVLSALALSLPLAVHAITIDDLRTGVPPCKQTKAKRPELFGDYELRKKVDEAYIPEYVLRADINGDGWCDHVLRWGGDFYARQPSIEATSIHELVILGGEKNGRLR